MPFRFIPTYVGHTLVVVMPVVSASVHPHIRGAYSLAFCSPIQVHRFIPTYVGHTASSSGTENTISVHPHIRGAYDSECVNLVRVGGSSPHTWGIRSGQGQGLISLRFIPTYVGHTRNAVKQVWQIGVHPHIRGAYLLCGSSSHSYIRFIPTYVGHTIFLS